MAAVEDRQELVGACVAVGEFSFRAFRYGVDAYAFSVKEGQGGSVTGKTNQTWTNTK